MKRTAAQALDLHSEEVPKRPLVDYESSEEEEEEASLTSEPQPAAVFESNEEVSLEDEPEEEAFCLEAIKQALPWAEYQGMGEEQFAAATQQTGGNPLGPLFHFEFSPVSDQQWLKRVQKNVYHTRLRQRRLPKDSDDVGVAIVNALETSTRQHLERIGAHPEDRVFLAITAHDFAHIYQTSEFTVREFMAGSTRLEQLMRKLAGKLNSNESFHPDQGFQLDLTLVRPLGTGSGHERGLNPGRMGYALSRQMKTSIIEIQNKDELCCARAIVTMKARAEWKVAEKRVLEEENKEVPDKVLIDKLKVEEKKKDYNTLRCTPKANKTTLQLQRTLAKHLHLVAGVPEGPCGLDELKKFQAYLATQNPPYQLKVFCDLVKKPIFTGPQKADEDHILVLIKSQNHYDGCGSLTGFLNRSYYCHNCDRVFNTNDPAHHSCLGRICKACGGNPCPDQFKRRDLSCKDCHGLFYGPACFQKHQTSGRCETYKTCTTCYAQYKTDKDHYCGHGKCHSCGETEDLAEHRCYIQPHEEEELEGGMLPPLFVYADIEAMIMPDRTFQPNLLCYQTGEEGDSHSLWGENCCDQFIQKLDKLSRVPVGKKKTMERTVIVLFHNLKGFDGMFIINSLYKDGREVKNQFSMGAKVLCFTSGPLTFKDSLCFLSMPLSSFPSTFGLRELKKGYFPHGFNTPEHQNYVGSIPPVHHFDPDGMKAEEKKEFEKWYAEQVNVVYDFKKELEEYCRSDVALLKAGCEAFVEQFSKEADFNPFEKCSTIASACNLYWRRSIEEDSPASLIAVRPLRGWHGAQMNQSIQALQWLAYRESLLPKEGAAADRIRHAKNGGEKKVRGYFVDGWDRTTNTIYEFQGCLWHACPKCYPNKRDLKHAIMPDRTPNEAYRATQEKTRRLREAGYTVIEMWECEWTAMVREDPGVKAFVNELESVDPLEPRDAFFGGRTGAVSLYAKAEGEEQIHYMDVTSLYPWVNKNAVYPLDHPNIITQPTLEEFPHYFGLAKVDILPPKKLFHPVLPMRSGGKLTFPLCATCVQEQQARPMLERSPICHHSPAQRQLRGTWCTPEIKKALEMGYELVRVHEVWHFEERESGLFADYVNTWLKIKTEASGWPKNCTTEAKKKDYIKRFKKKEGIRLEFGKIEKNPGLKATAKLMLNSFWGKFGQRENLPQVQQCTSPNELYNVLEDDTLQVTNIRICTEEVLEVVYTNTEETVFPSNKTNVFIAAFTTCWARLKLYSYLETLGEQVLYYDTDSVIYKWSPNQPKITTGDYLGDMKDELEGDHIVEFVSGGAKNYGYQTDGGKTECKVRGFTLNVRGLEVLNYTSMKNTILKELEEPLEKKRQLQVTNPSHFQRNTTTKEIGLVEQTKRYGLVFDKRVINVSTKQSYPFGYFQSQ